MSNEELESNAEVNMPVIMCSKKLDPSRPIMCKTEEAKQWLSSVGFQDGMWLPSGLPEYINEVSKVAGIPPTTEGVKAMFELPEVKLSLENAIIRATEVANKKKVAENKVKDIIPDMESISPAIREPLRKMAETMAENQIEEEAAKPISDKVKSQFQPVAAVEEEVKEEEPIKPTIAKKEMPAMEKPISDSDMNAFVYSVLAGKPFEKTYSVFNGQLQITFRELTVKDVNLIYKQLQWDQSNLEAKTFDEIRILDGQYAIVAALASMQVPGARSAIPPVPDSIDEDQFKSANNTNMKKYYQYVSEKIIVTANRFEMLQKLYMDFIELVRRLKETAIEENF